MAPYWGHCSFNYIWQEGLRSFPCTCSTADFFLECHYSRCLEFREQCSFCSHQSDSAEFRESFFGLITIVFWMYWQGPAWLGRRRRRIEEEAMIRGLAAAAQSMGSHRLYSHCWDWALQPTRSAQFVTEGRHWAATSNVCLSRAHSSYKSAKQLEKFLIVGRSSGGACNPPPFPFSFSPAGNGREQKALKNGLLRWRLPQRGLYSNTW